MRNFAFIVIGLAAFVALMADGDGMFVAPVEPSQESEADTHMVERPEAASVAFAGPTYSSEVQFERGAGGHFFTDAAIGGTSVRFLVDTGATGIALTEQDARRLGLPFDASEFRVVGRQVSGEIRGKPVMLPEVRVGSKSVRDVEAMIIEGGTMNLLGQSFLTRAGRIEMDGNTMVLR